MRSARRATWLTFFVTGAVFATFASRIPALQDRLDVSAGSLSLAFLALNAGAVAGLPAGGRLSTRLGARGALRCGFAVYPLGLAVAGVAPSLTTLCLALGLMALGNSVIDVAMNVEGVAIERRLGRPILSSLHAAHSFGVLAGAAAGYAAASAGLRVPLHFCAVAAAGVVCGLAATAPLLETRDGQDERGGVRPTRRLALLGLLAFCAFLCEGGANDWSAVHVRSAYDTGEGTGAAAFVGFALAVAVGRLAGDRVVTRVGRAGAARGGGGLAAIGLGMAIAAPAAAPALAGWLLTGAGLSVLAPTIIGAAPDVATTPEPIAIATVTAFGYLGSFSGPPMIGALADATSLPTALGLPCAAAALVAILAPRALRRAAATS